MTKFAKVLVNASPYIDLTDKTVTPSTLKMGSTAHKANGEEIVGTTVFTDPKVENEIITRTISGTYSNSEVTQLKYGAFRVCSSLTSVDFPNVSIVGSYAFAGCSSLSSVSFPNATSIGSCAFWSCTSLSQATFSKVSIVNVSAFNDCSGLVSISLPEATWLSNQAFIRCYNLETVYAPKTKNIDNECF